MLLTLMVSRGWPDSTLQIPPNPPVIKDLMGFALRSAGAFSTFSTTDIFDQFFSAYGKKLYKNAIIDIRKLE